MPVKPQKIQKGVLLLQMGGPCCTFQIEDFLYNLFRDKYIIQLPWPMSMFQEQFAKFVSSKRAPKVAKLYEEIGGGSPICAETANQAYWLEQKLNAIHGEKHKVFFAMRYTAPFLKDTIKEMERYGIKELTVLPLYPHYSIATSGSSIIECKELFAETGFDKSAEIRYIESWHDNHHFIDLIVKRIQARIDELNQIGVTDPNKYYIMFSAHGLPQKYVDDGDPYEKQIQKSVEMIMGRFPMNKHTLCYQSKVGPLKWLGPSTGDALKKLIKDKGVKNIIVVPISFVGDHVETLHEINIEYREEAEEYGVKHFEMTELPKSDPMLIDALVTAGQLDKTLTMGTDPFVNV